MAKWTNFCRWERSSTWGTGVDKSPTLDGNAVWLPSFSQNMDDTLLYFYVLTLPVLHICSVNRPPPGLQAQVKSTLYMSYLFGSCFVALAVLKQIWIGPVHGITFSMIGKVGSRNAIHKRDVAKLDVEYRHRRLLRMLAGRPADTHSASPWHGTLIEWSNYV